MLRRLEGLSVVVVLVLARTDGSAQPASSVAAKLAEGVWAYVGADGEVVVSGSFLGVPPDSLLLPDALAARQSFDFRTDDPVLGCGAPGMPRAFTAGSPMTFTWSGSGSGADLTITYESMDVERTVDMSGEPPRADTPRTPNGHAIGRWDGDTLVIETSLLDGRVVDLLGTPKSDAMTLEERYSIDTDGNETHLRIDLTMTDPEIFTAPYLWHFDFVLRPDWALMEYDCVERPIDLTPGVVPD
ncbi:MAG TPA: hypothetical protein VIM81_01730 [Gammaproteobacteria bacterium]